MSGSLANRLVEAVAENMLRRYQFEFEASHLSASDFTAEAKADVAAVLRELAASGAALEEFGGDMPAACLALAGVVEGGEQDG